MSLHTPSIIRRHPVASFFLLAYALTWGAIPWNSFFVPGVLISAVVIITLTDGRAGFRALGSRLIRWRVGWVWYALAVVVPLLVHTIAMSGAVALGSPVPSLVQFLPWYSLPMAIGLHIVNPSGGPLFEEPTLRGFAQPRLQASRSPLAATVIMALAVTLWHAPLFFMPVFRSSPVEGLSTIAVTFWYAWLLNHASGSVLITLLAHGVEGSIETSDLWADAADPSRETWLYSLTWCAVAMILLVGNRRFWTGRSPAVAVDERLVDQQPPDTVRTGSVV